eukprot:SAG31_NODE_4589_length_3107_cov_2.071120_2_plen_59_part_00
MVPQIAKRGHQKYWKSWGKAVSQIAVRNNDAPPEGRGVSAAAVAAAARRTASASGPTG